MTSAVLLLAAAAVIADPATHTVTLTAKSTDCGMDTPLEFLLVGPRSDHGYEAMFVTEAEVGEIAAAFAEAGIPCGIPFDDGRCRFWPAGASLTMTPAFGSLVREMRKDLTPSVVYTGGARDAKGIPEADTNMPSAVFALYNCGQSLMQFDDTLDQSTTYGRFQPAVKIPEGESRTFTFTWNGTNGFESVDLPLAPGGLHEALVGLKARAEKVEVSVTPDFSSELSLKEAGEAATMLSLVDSARVKINGYRSGQFYYRAFMPLEKWRDRKERLAQPPELHIKADGTYLVTRIVEDWSDDESIDPRLVVTDHPCATLSEAVRLASDFIGKTQTLLVFTAPETRLSVLYTLRAAFATEIPNWYFFTE